MLTLGLDNCDRDTRTVLEDVVGPKFVCASVLASDGDDPAIGDPELVDDLVVVPPSLLQPGKAIVTTGVGLRGRRAGAAWSRMWADRVRSRPGTHATRFG